MPKKPLHERLRGLLPESVQSRVPEKLKPPAWKAPTYATPDWAREGEELTWVLGDPVRVRADGWADRDTKGRPLKMPLPLNVGLTGRLVAIGPEWVVVKWDDGERPSVRVAKSLLENLRPISERKWAQADDLEARYRALYEAFVDAGMRDGRYTIDGVTYVLLAPDHPKLKKSLTYPGLTEWLDELESNLEQYRAGATVREKQRAREEREKALSALGQDVEDELPESGSVWMYHATSSKLLPSILKHGLRPERAGSTWTRGEIGGATQDCVYLHATGTGPEVDTYLRRAVAVHGGEGVLLRVLVDAEDLEPDPDDADIASGRRQYIYCGTIEPERIMQMNGDWLDPKKQGYRIRRRGKFIEVSLRPVRVSKTAMQRAANKKLKGFERMMNAPMPAEAVGLLKQLDPQGKKGYITWAVAQARAMVSEEAAGPGWQPTDAERAAVDQTFAAAAWELKKFDERRDFAPEKELIRIPNLQALKATTEAAEAQWWAEPRAERAESEQLTEAVLRFDSKDAAALEAGGSTAWCFAKWQNTYWETYKQRENELYQVTVHGQRYGVAIKDGLIVEIKNVENEEPSGSEVDAVRAKLSEAGIETEYASAWADYGLDAAEWTAAGFDDPDVASYWDNHGFAAESARAWSDNGFDDPEKAKEWEDVNIDPQDAQGFSTEEISPTDAESIMSHFDAYADWAQLPSDFRKWLLQLDEQGVLLVDFAETAFAAAENPALLTAWAGLETEAQQAAFVSMWTDVPEGDMVEWAREIGYLAQTDMTWASDLATAVSAERLTLDVLRAWQDADRRQAFSWAPTGWSPQEADELSQLGLPSVHAIRWREFFETVEGVKRWRPLFGDEGAKAAFDWSLRRLTPEEAKAWIDAGWTDPHRVRRQMELGLTQSDPQGWSDLVQLYSYRRKPDQGDHVTYEQAAEEVAQLATMGLDEKAAVDWAKIVNEFGMDGTLEILGAEPDATLRHQLASTLAYRMNRRELPEDWIVQYQALKDLLSQVPKSPINQSQVEMLLDYIKLAAPVELKRVLIQEHVHPSAASSYLREGTQDAAQLYEVIRWKHVKLDPHVWAGFEPAEARTWSAQGFSSGDRAISWRNHGFTPEDAVRWWRKTLLPADLAAQRRDQGQTPEEIEAADNARSRQGAA